jgi:hypothetical protein
MPVMMPGAPSRTGPILRTAMILVPTVKGRVTGTLPHTSTEGFIARDDYVSNNDTTKNFLQATAVIWYKASPVLNNRCATMRETTREMLLQAAKLRLDRARQDFLDAEGQSAPSFDLRLEVYRARSRRDEIAKYGKPVVNI